MWSNLDLGTLDFTKIGSQLGEAIQNVKTAAERTVDTALGIDPSATGQPAATSTVTDVAWAKTTPSRGITVKEPSFAYEDPIQAAGITDAVPQQLARPQRKAPGSVQPVLKHATGKLLHTGNDNEWVRETKQTVHGTPATSSSHHHMQNDHEEPHFEGSSPSASNSFNSRAPQSISNNHYQSEPAATRSQKPTSVSPPLQQLQPSDGADIQNGSAAHGVKLAAGAAAGPKKPAAKGKPRLGAVRKVAPTATPAATQQQEGTSEVHLPQPQDTNLAGTRQQDSTGDVHTPQSHAAAPAEPQQQACSQAAEPVLVSAAAAAAAVEVPAAMVAGVTVATGAAAGTAAPAEEAAGVQQLEVVAGEDSGLEMNAATETNSTAAAEIVATATAEAAQEEVDAEGAETIRLRPAQHTVQEQEQAACRQREESEPRHAQNGAPEPHETVAGVESSLDVFQQEPGSLPVRESLPSHVTDDSLPGAGLAADEEDGAIMAAVEQVIQECSPDDAAVQLELPAEVTDKVDLEVEERSDQLDCGNQQPTVRPAEEREDREDGRLCVSNQEHSSGMTHADLASAAESWDHQPANQPEARLGETERGAAADDVPSSTGRAERGPEPGADAGVSRACESLRREDLAGWEHAQLVQLVEKMREENERLSWQLLQNGQATVWDDSTDSLAAQEKDLFIQRLQAANAEHAETIHQLQDTNSEHLSTIDDLQAANAAYVASAQEMKKELVHLRDKVTKLESENSEHKEINSELETRLAATERKVYALTKERDALKKGGSKLADINLLVKEKDEIIKSVMDEGEKLSKKCGDLEERVRSLRGQLKDSETQIAILNSRVAEEESKIASLTKTKAQLEREVAMTQQNAKTDLEQLRMTYEEKLRQQSLAQAEAESKAKDVLVEKYQRMAKEAEGRADALSDTVVELKEALERQREAAHLREELLQQDLANLEHRCQVAETRHQELTSKMPDATRPLLRQIEAMQMASAAQLQACAAAEKMLEQRIMDAEAAAAAAMEREALAQERLQVLQSKLSSSDAALTVARSDIRRLYSELDASSASREEAIKEADVKLEHLRQRLSDVQSQLQQAELKAQAQLRLEQEARLVLENDTDVLRKELEDVRAKLEAKQKEASTSGSSKPGTEATGTPGGPPAMAAHGYKWVLVKNGEAPPTSTHSSSSPPDVANSSTSGSRAAANGGGSNDVLGSDAPSSSRGVSSMEIEGLLAELRQKQGDVMFLQHQIEEMKTERTRLSEELVQAAHQCEQALQWQRQVQQLQTEMQALQVKYSAAVEMLGEKDERLDELMADLQDVKQLYRDQIEFMCVQLVSAQSQANTPSSSIGDLRGFAPLSDAQ